MKQKITFLSIILALLGGFSQTAFAQVVFSESFDGTTFPPPGWTLATPIGNTNPFGNIFGCNDTSWVWVANGGAVCGAFSGPIPTHTGAGMAGYNSGSIGSGPGGNNPSNSYLTTPAIDFSVPGAQYRISFWYFADGASNDAVDVYITTNPAGPFTTSILTVNPNNTNGWAQHTVIVPATYNGPSNYITFKSSGTGQLTLVDEYIDDIAVTQFQNCFGQPNATIIGPSSVCGGIPFTLADTSTATAFALGITYQWQSRLTGTLNFSNFPGGTTASITTSIGLPTDFRLIEKCAFSGMSDTTPIHTVGINAFYNCYCGPNTGVNLAGTSPNPLIDSVSVTPGTLMNGTFTQLPAPNYYASYAPPVGNLTTSLQQGGTYTLTSILGSFNGTAQGWIDFDQSGTFDASEWINLPTPSASYVASGQFTVPQTGPTGLTGLRVRTGGNSSATSPCDNHDGETEDYVINIIPAPLNDMGATLILQPLTNSTICANTNFTIKAVIKNLGTAEQSHILVKATYGNGSANNTIYTYDVDTITSFASDTVTIGTMAIPTEGLHTLKVYTTLANDGNTSDDTAMSSILVTALPAAPIAISDTVCLGDTARIGVIGEAGNTYSWYNAPSGGSVLFTGMTSVIDSLINTTIYYVSSTTTGITSHLPVTPITSGTEGCTGGITYDIQALTNLTVDSFAARFNSTGLQQVNVYYRQGTAAGNETNPNAWVLVGSDVITVASTSATYFVNVHVPLALTSGDTYGIYMNYNAAYSDAGGTPTYADGNMIVDFTNGLGLCGTFSSATATHMYFNGSVYYHTGGSDCESNRIPVVAAVGPKPIIDLGLDRTVCQSPTLILDAGNQGGTYAWNTGDSTQKIHVDTSGTYTVIVNKYCLDTATVNLIVEPQPVASGVNYTRAGNTYSFKVSGTKFVDGYYWKFGDGNTSTDSTPVHTYATGNPYNIVLVVYNGCGSDTIHWSVPTSVTSLSKNDNPIVLYPNPASSTLSVSGSDNMQIKDVIIINAVGAVVYKGNINKAKSGNIDISKLASGHYILRANTSDGYYSQPFDVLRN